MGSLDQVVQWLGLALLLFLGPVLVMQFMMRDRASWSSKRFWVFACLSVIFSLTFVWHHELNHWFSYDLKNETEELIFGAIIMIPVLLILIVMTRWGTGKWLYDQTCGFRICIGGVFVALMASGVIWLLDEEGKNLLSFDGFQACALVGLGIYMAVSLLWNMVGRISVEHRAATARILMRCYFLSVVLLGIMSKVFYEEEKYWVERNEMWKPTADYPTQAWKVVLPKIEKEHRRFFESLPEIKSE